MVTLTEQAIYRSVITERPGEIASKREGLFADYSSSIYLTKAKHGAKLPLSFFFSCCFSEGLEFKYSENTGFIGHRR